MDRGRIAEIKKKNGYGFIAVGADEEAFFQRKDCLDLQFEHLHEGQQVEFEIDRSGRPGVLRAHKVRLAAPS